MKSSTEIAEDEKDPDVIPQGKKTEKALNSSMLPVSSNYGKCSESERREIFYG